MSKQLKPENILSVALVVLATPVAWSFDQQAYEEHFSLLVTTPTKAGIEY